MKKLVMVFALFALAFTPQELRDEAQRLEQTKQMLLDAADQIDTLEAALLSKDAEISDLNAQIVVLQARIKELEEQLPPPPPPSCQGVQVAAGANLTTVAGANPPGTTFCLAAGTYTLSASVVGQQGDLFLGAGRDKTFIKGNGTLQHLMTSAGGDDFEVRSLDISGAVGDFSCNPNCGRAFRVTGIITIRDVRCHHNDNQCAGSGGGGVRMFNSECDNNGWGEAFNVNSSDRSGACIKKASTNMEIVEVRDSYIHHNGWAGVWCDFCSPDSRFLVVNNVIEDNASKGVSYEVSGGYSANDFGLVQGNTIKRNGLLDERTISSGITCNSCADLTIENNIFGGNMGNRAVGLINARRGPWGDLANIIIRNNTLNGDTLPCSMVGVTCSNNTP